MRNAILLISIILLILSSNCSNDKTLKVEKLSDKTFPLSFQKEKEISFEFITKTRISFAKINDPEHLYLKITWNKDKDCEFVKLSNDLEVKDRFLVKHGIGPGEVRNLSFYGGDTESIRAYDKMGHKYLRFDGNFKLIDEFKETVIRAADSPLVGRYEIKKDVFVEGFGQIVRSINKPDICVYYDMGVSVKRILPGNQVEEKKVFSFPHKKQWIKGKMPVGNDTFFTVAFNSIYILNGLKYKLLKMNYNGEVLKEKMIDVESRTLAEEGLKKTLEYFYGKRDSKEYYIPEKLVSACWITAIGNGILVGRCNDYDPEDRGPVTVDLFDKDLNYLGNIKFPYFKGWNFPIIAQTRIFYGMYYRNGKLYQIIEDDESHKIIIWKVINESKI